MKRKVFILFVSALALITSVTYAQGGQSRSVSGFSSIESGGPFNVHVKINGTESIKLDIDEDVINDVRTEVVGGVLKIGFKNNFSFKHRNIKRGEIYVTAKSLEALANSGSGSLDLDGVLTGQSVRVILSGSGNMKAAVKAGSLESRLSGSGGIDLKGSADEANLRISGSGNIEGKSLTAQTVAANVTGSGGITIRATKTISSRITGSGSVDYSGGATVGEDRHTGSGRLNKVD
jgi:hypothetical protein